MEGGAVIRLRTVALYRPRFNSMGPGVPELFPWQVSGSYLEACNCLPICPCRRVGSRLGGRSTYGVCDFALSWRIAAGRAGTIDLSGLSVVLAGSYDDDEPGSPWRVALYVDERADPGQQSALADIFLGRAGGTSLQNFAAHIGEVYAVRPARIDLEHEPAGTGIRAGQYVTVSGVEAVFADGPVSCAIPGHDRPGTEMRAELQRVDDPPLRWDVRGRCGFLADFDYRSDAA